MICKLGEKIFWGGGGMTNILDKMAPSLQGKINSHNLADASKAKTINRIHFGLGIGEGTLKKIQI